MQIHRLDRQHPLFPKQLLQIPQPPHQLYAIGNLQLLEHQDMLAVVGSRAVSSYGREVTNRLVTELAWSSVVIVSGLALGVDSLAHRAALEAKGSTIAVLPSGIESFYPASHQPLGQEIIRGGGLVISEYDGTAKPQNHHFIARNRLIAGLSKAVLVTEAAVKSGSLHTAQFALEQGKEVMTVPGSIFSPTSVGCHNLIKEGAQLVQDSEDILNFFNTSYQSKLPVGDTPQEQELLDLMNEGLTQTYELLNKSQMEIQLFNRSLTMLEITGKVKRRGQAQWSLR